MSFPKKIKIDKNTKSENVVFKLDKTKISNWPNGYDDDDSIFSEINLTKECDFLDAQEDTNSVIQCTQKFLDDLNSSFILLPDNEQLDYAKFFHETQYETSEEIYNKTIKSDINVSYKDEVRAISDITWRTQIFPEEIYNFPEKGPFFGLPKTVEKLIYEHKGIKNLYEWQKECLNLPAIYKRKNLIYALPTSGGKTLVAEILMLREIICRQKNVLFILPYVSIVQEKVSAMAPFALYLNFLVEEYSAGKGKCPPTLRKKCKTIFIASIEKGAVLFDSLIEAQRANEIGLVVVDELHLIGEKSRGATLETFLTKVKCLNAGIQIIGMSATIGNLPDLSKFLDSDVYTRGFRPIELKEYIKCGNDILEIKPHGCNRDTLFSFHRTVNFKYSQNVLRSDPDHLAGLVSEVIPNESCLIFCSTRKNCENVALLLTNILPRKYIDHRNTERSELIDAIEKISGALTPTLAKTIPYGIAYHHSGLTIEERKLLEFAYRFGTLCVICCTSTLSAGVNLPAKRVIIRAPYVGNQFITLCQYKQMVGRAGRAGMGDTGESFLICSTKDNFQVGQMLYSPMDKVKSAMLNFNGIGLQSLILGAIGLKVIENLGDLFKLIEQSLLSVQSVKLEINIKLLVSDILRKMFKHKILKVTQLNNKIPRENYSSIITTQELGLSSHNNLTTVTKYSNISSHNTLSTATTKLILSRSSKFELSIIGRAAFKAGIDYKRAEKMYIELKKGQESLVLTNYSHLLYLIVSLNTNDDDNNIVNVEPTILFREYNNLDDGTRHLVKIIGITEAHAVKMIKQMSIKGPLEIQFNRLYKVLILNDVLNTMPLHLIANKYNFERGMIQNLISQSISAISCVIRLCDEINEFWCYKPLFEKLTEKLDRCCVAELMPLLDLPAVKINRAKQLFSAGFKTIEDIAQVTPKELSKSIEHMPLRTAKEIVSAAKLILLRKLETLQDETEAILNCLNSS